MKLQEEINELRQHFRILQGWEISLNNDSKYKAQMCANVQKKMAVIYGWPDDEVPEDYILHELMHICLRVIHHPKGYKREAEELFIQDVCELWKQKNINSKAPKDLKGGLKDANPFHQHRAEAQKS